MCDVFSCFVVLRLCVVLVIGIGVCVMGEDDVDVMCVVEWDLFEKFMCVSDVM